MGSCLVCLLIRLNIYPSCLGLFFTLLRMSFCRVGVAFSKHIVQIYTCNPTGDLRQHLEVKLLPGYCFSLGNSRLLVIDFASHLLD